MNVAPISFTAATPGSTLTENRTDELNNSFQSMVSELMQNGVGNDYMQSILSNQERFVSLVAQAEQEGGDAKAFIRNLNAEDREALQKVHGLALPITDSDIDQMSDEGAANLLKMRGDGLDSNHDGLTDTGTAQSFKFPNSNTPANVAAAWNKSIEGMSFEDRLMAEGAMMTELIFANMRIDDNGKVIRAEPGDIDWVNPFNENYSYQDWANKRLAYLEAFKSSMSADQYSSGKQFASTFLANLKSEGAA